MRQSPIKKLYEKFCIRQWTLGFFRGSMEDIIRSKSFDPNIQWLSIEPFHRFFADPFFYGKEKADLYLMVEEFDINKGYGKISLLTFNEPLKLKSAKILLDTGSHLSYPFIFKENGRVYVFPEAGKSGRLSCYEYDFEAQKLIFLQTIIDLPVMDPTILKYNGKYWVFGTSAGVNARKQLFIFFADNILGPYKPHSKNPVTDSLNGSRPAGQFIDVDGTVYRPAQNCSNRYGESITINKVNWLDEFNYEEEPYMLISINKKNKRNAGIHSIHTINACGDMVVVDGEMRAFYPFSKLKYRFKKNKTKHRIQTGI